MNWKQIIAREYLILVCVVLSIPLTGGFLLIRNEVISLKSYLIEKQLNESSDALDPKPPNALAPTGAERRSFWAERYALMAELRNLSDNLMGEKDILKWIWIVFKCLAAFSLLRLMTLGVIWSLRILRS
jgi:hypothetical protein